METFSFLPDLASFSDVDSKSDSKSDSRHGVHASVRSRYFLFLLYPDNPIHVRVYDWIVKNEDFISILHDSDVKSTAAFDSDLDFIDDSSDSVVNPDDDFETLSDSLTVDLKKAHYHVLVRFPNARTIKGVRKYFNFEIDRFVEVCSDPYSTAQYFIHDTYECHVLGKHLYSISDVQGSSSLKARLFSARKYAFSENILTQLISIIEGRSVTSMRSLFKFLITHDLPDLLEFCLSHSYLVRTLLISEDKFSGYGNDSFLVEKRHDDSPLSVQLSAPKRESFFKAVEQLIYDNVHTDSPDLVLSNRSQRRKSKKKR